MKKVSQLKAPAADVDDQRRQLGLRLRLARQSKDLTLKALALRLSCSESLLSKIENGIASPSVSLVHRMVRVLEVNISWLFDEREPEEEFVFRAGKRPTITLDPQHGGDGVTLERIIPYKGAHLLQCNIHHLEVGGRSGEVIVHEGEEVGFVLKGAIEILIDDKPYELKAGDAFCFRSQLPHSYRNIGKTAASILWTCTPPTF
jgi:transcriptional regulator with XRE-family HTH domain